MHKSRPAFKNTQVFDWESEPKAERPSEFHTTGFSTASGYYYSLDEAHAPSPSRRADRTGTALLLAGLLAALGLGTVGLYWLPQLLRG